MAPTAVRVVDVGLLEPELFHATYAAIALAAGADAAPVVLWGRARAHLSIGQSQDPEAEVASDVALPVVRRPLGGGAVWVDEEQYCYVLIAPPGHAPRRPADWFEWGLGPAIATHRAFGLHVVRVEQDLWLDGRKIAGSGAATIGACAVLASSFLIRFPTERFARCVRAPSAAYRDWLIAGLAAAMTDWRSHRPPPDPALLKRVFCRALRAVLGWRPEDSALDDRERTLRRETLEEMADPGWCAGERLLPGGIRLNALSYLTEEANDTGVTRTLNIRGAIVRQERSAARSAGP